MFQSNKEVAQVFPLMNPKLNGNLDKKEIYEVLQYHGVKVSGNKRQIPKVHESSCMGIIKLLK